MGYRSPFQSLATRVLRELGQTHSHVMLSHSVEPGVSLLQMFVFPKVRDIPDVLDSALGWAIKRGLVEVVRPTSEPLLTPEGDDLVRNWSENAVVV